MSDRSVWVARVRAAIRLVLLALVAELVAVLVLLPVTARFLAPLGFLLPWRGPRAAAVSLLLDVPLVAAASAAAFVLGRIGEGRPAARAAFLVAVLWFLDAASGLFVNANLDRWLDGWSAAARLGAIVTAWALARWILRRAEAPSPMPPVAPPAARP